MALLFVFLGTQISNRKQYMYLWVCYQKMIYRTIGVSQSLFWQTKAATLVSNTVCLLFDLIILKKYLPVYCTVHIEWQRYLLFLFEIGLHRAKPVPPPRSHSLEASSQQVKKEGLERGNACHLSENLAKNDENLMGKCCCLGEK